MNSTDFDPDDIGRKGYLTLTVTAVLIVALAFLFASKISDHNTRLEESIQAAYSKGFSDGDNYGKRAAIRLCEELLEKIAEREK